MFKEFKEFALNGSLIDIAVGLFMATAFGTIVTAFVDGMFMPVVGQIFQMGDLKHAKIILESSVIGPDGRVLSPEVAIAYGSFLSALINFIIIAFIIFIFIKAMNNSRKSEPTPETSPTEALLTEIRDLLNKK